MFANHKEPRSAVPDDGKTACQSETMMITLYVLALKKYYLRKEEQKIRHYGFAYLRRLTEYAGCYYCKDLSTK